MAPMAMVTVMAVNMAMVMATAMPAMATATRKTRRGSSSEF